MDDTPKGFTEVKTDTVFYNQKTAEIVICGCPNEDMEHNCDWMGCSSLSHVLMRGYLTTNCPINLGE